MTIIQFSAADDSFVSIRAAYSNRGAALTPTERLDYSANYSNCPAHLAGLGEAPLVIVEPSLSSRQKRAVEPAASEGELVSGEWRLSVSAATKTRDERRAEIKAAATAKYRDLLAGGKVVSVAGNSFRLATDHDAIVEIAEGLRELDSSSPEESFGIVTRSGQPINFTAEVGNAMLVIIRTFVRAAQSRENAIHLAAEAAWTANDHDAFDAIDVTAGWPVSE